MARPRISNRAEVIDQILKKYETLENFSAKTGYDYTELIANLMQGNRISEEMENVFRIHNIDVSLTEK